MLWTLLVLFFLSFIYFNINIAIYQFEGNLYLPFTSLNYKSHYLLMYLPFANYFQKKYSKYVNTNDIYLPFTCTKWDTNCQIPVVFICIIYIYYINNMMILSCSDHKFKLTNLVRPHIYFIFNVYFNSFSISILFKVTYLVIPQIYFIFNVYLKGYYISIVFVHQHTYLVTYYHYNGE